MKYPEGIVFCPICHKQLTKDDDKERGFHLHCELSEVFCEGETKESESRS